MSEKALQIAEERREPKSKRDRKSYIQLNAEFLRIARKNKPFLNEHCAKAEENIRMGRTRDLFKKIGDTKRTFHARITTIKDRNSKDLIEAEEIRK